MIEPVPCPKCNNIFLVTHAWRQDDGTIELDEMVMCRDCRYIFDLSEEKEEKLNA